jgi:hypothetical protein
MRATLILVLTFLTLLQSLHAADANKTRTRSEAYLEKVSDEQVAANAKSIDEAFVKQKTTIQKLMSQADQLHISASLGDTVDALDGVGLGLRYRYEVEPSFIGGYYTRRDSYRVNLKLEAHRWLFDDKTPWILRLEPETQMHFWQAFSTVEEARSVPNGYTPARFPITAQKAVDNLKAGDLVYLRARLNLNVGAQKEWPLPGHFEVRGEAYYLLSGLFDIFIFRAEDNKIRIRLAARRDRGPFGKVSVGVEDDFKIFGMDMVDNTIVRVLQLDELWMALTARTNQNIYLADYTLDLNYPEVREAYDELFAKALRLKLDNPLLQVTDPRNNREEVRDKLVSNLTKLNDIFREDVMAGVNPIARRVERTFSGSNGSANSTFHQVKYGIRSIYKTNNFTVRRDNQMALSEIHPDGTETTDYYLFPTWTQSKEMRAWASNIREHVLHSSTMIYRTDSAYNVQEFKSAGFYYDYKDRRYFNGEHQKILQHFKTVLPEKIFKDFVAFLRTLGLDQFQDMKRQAQLSARYFVTDEGLDLVEEVIERLPVMERAPFILRLANEQMMSSGLDASRYSAQAMKLAELLSVVFDKQATPKQRHLDMDALSGLELYRLIGPSVLFKMLREEHLEHAGHFEIKFYLPQPLTPVIYTYPRDIDFPDRRLYESIFDLQRMMDDLIPDMRIDGEEDNLTKRKVSRN